MRPKGRTAQRRIARGSIMRPPEVSVETQRRGEIPRVQSAPRWVGLHSGTFRQSGSTFNRHSQCSTKRVLDLREILARAASTAALEMVSVFNSEEISRPGRRIQ